MVGKLGKLFAALLCCLLVGCVVHPDKNELKLNSLPEHFSQYDVMMAWQCQQEGTGTSISGVVKNVRYHSMDDLAIWVSERDLISNKEFRSVSYVNPPQLPLNWTAPFEMRLPVQVKACSKLRFNFVYRPNEGISD